MRGLVSNSSVVGKLQLAPTIAPNRSLGQAFDARFCWQIQDALHSPKGTSV